MRPPADPAYAAGAIALAAVLMLCASCRSSRADGFDPPGLGQASAWQAMPAWLSYIAAERGVSETPEGLDFWARGRSLGMKWLASLAEPVDAELQPWLVLRYRCQGYLPDVDYALWLTVDGVPEGVKLVTPDLLRADGEWHTLALDLAAGDVGVVTGVAVQCRSAGDEAHLTVAELRFAAAPPAGAETSPAAGQPAKLRDYDPGPAEGWRAEPAWLGDPSSVVEARRTDGGVRLTVRGRGLGMKWSHAVAGEPLPRGYFRVRYRARGLETSSPDYALYAANAGGGKAPDEEYVLRLNQLIADGQPHVAVGFCKVAGARTLAAQVQVAGGQEEAWVELGPVEIWSLAPAARLEDYVAATAGWPAAMRGWRSVALPDGLSATAAAGLLGAEGWWPAGKLTVAGVPFQVRDGGVPATGRADLGTIAVPLAGRARQLYLLLGAWLPTRAANGYNPDAGGVCSAPSRFVCEIHYRGGAVERQMPTAVGSGRQAVTRGAGVYALAVDGGRELERLVLVDGHRRGAFLLYGLTASAAEGPATVATRPRRAPEVKARARPAARMAVDASQKDQVVVNSGALHVKLLTRRGLEVGAVTSDYLPALPTLAWVGSLFSVKVGDVEARSAEGTVAGVEALGPDRAAIAVSLAPALPIEARLTVSARPGDEMGLELELTPTGELRAEPEVLLPSIVGARATADPAATWVFYPSRGPVISDRPFRRAEPYSGIFPLQVMGLWAPTGGGLYVRTEYTEPLPDRRYEADHGDRGVALGVRYSWWRGEKLNAVIGVNAGDWHGQLAAYNRWRVTWFQPAAPRKDWFRRIFNFRQIFLTFPVPRPSGAFDPQTKALHLAEAVGRDRQAFGGVDYLHIFDWGWSPERGRCGDYAPWTYLGGADNFRHAVEGLIADGTPVGLYIEGYLISPESSVFERAKAWQVIKANGDPLEAFAPEIDMCPWVADWQDYLSTTYGRVRRETGALGFYIDEYGFAGDWHTCYSKTHGHPSPIHAAGGQIQMTRKIRAALGPDAAIYTEESPCDVTMQQQDGSFTYAITTTADDLSPSHLNTTRFAVPDFKTIEILFCDQPTRDDVEDLGHILFNGEAIWLEGTPEVWFDARSLEFIRRMHTIMRAEADCFTTLAPEALVPTLWADLYANRFPRADGKRCVWTVSWKGPRTLSGDWLAVPHVAGAKYRELWDNRPLKVRRAGAVDVIGGAIHPHEVLVVVQETP